MKTLELIRADEPQLIPLLRAMKLKELEKHAENLVRILGGGNTYPRVLREVIKALPQLPETAERFALLQEVLLRFVPRAAEQKDLLVKLAVIMSLIVALKFKEIHSGR